MRRKTAKVVTNAWCDSKDEMAYYLENVQSQRDESPFKKVQSAEQCFLERHLNCESVDIGSENSIQTITFKAQSLPKALLCDCLVDHRRCARVDGPSPAGSRLPRGRPDIVAPSPVPFSKLIWSSGMTEGLAALL
jgi:hypothetical protein